MPDMYDKLGELLNEALESGEIPQSKKTIDDQNFEEKLQNSGHLHFKNNEKKAQKKPKTSETNKTKQFSTGEVIKLHKYTYNMQFSPEILKALSTLDIVYPFTQKDITTAYHKKLKENHPDIKNTIQNYQHVDNFRQLSIDEIRLSYQILCDFFGIK